MRDEGNDGDGRTYDDCMKGHGCISRPSWQDARRWNRSMLPVLLWMCRSGVPGRKPDTTGLLGGWIHDEVGGRDCQND